jgi:hypothetical protein
MKYFQSNVLCPHCKGKNRVVVDPPRTYDQTTLTVRCWDAEAQTGCMKEFDLHQQVRVMATPTKEQMRLHHNEQLNSDKSLADRMGGSD